LLTRAVELGVALALVVLPLTAVGPGRVAQAQETSRSEDESDGDGDGDAGAVAGFPPALGPTLAPTHEPPGPPATATAAERVAWLRQRIDSLLGQRPELASARVGIAIVDLTEGAVLYERDADAPANAASNTKLVTATAALALLGPDFHPRTVVYGAPVDGRGVVRGNLVVRGGGDPSLDLAALRDLCDQLAASGVRRVKGGLVIDDSYFDRVDEPPHFDEQPDENAAFRAPVSAAALTFNAVTLVVRPGPRAGADAQLGVAPPGDYVRVTGTVATVAAGRTRLAVDLRPQPGSLELHVRGQIRLDAGERSFRHRVHEPWHFFGAAFQAALRERGIRLDRRRLTRGPAPARAIPLATREGPSVAELVRNLGKHSNNFVAEMLLKTLGAELIAAGPAATTAGAAATAAGSPRPATWADGQAAVRRFLIEEIGLADGSFRYDNGSGLFDSNRFSPRQLCTLLVRAYRDFRYGPDLLASLAIGGVDGTLATRLVGGPAERRVRAKTGTLATVSALSGVVATDGARPIVFSILINSIPERREAVTAARALQDDVVEALIRYAGADS
jgi:D-alanyl-D-alanine carboxypeptidase/D-alanyl-D-alanine-endopeptidase (penicillin-binding protein 4)